jgi:hypothetical protein
MESLIAACNTGGAYDEDRLDHLIRCMDYNPEHQREKEEAARQWRREIQPLIDEVCDDRLLYIRLNISVNFHYE